MSEIKNGGLDQYGAVAFEQQKFGTAGVEGVNEFCKPDLSEIPAFLPRVRSNAGKHRYPG